MKQLEQKPVAPIEAPPLSITPIEKQETIDSSQGQERKTKAQDLKKFKQTDKLIKAITDLSTLTKKKTDDEKKDKAPTTIRGFLVKMAKEGVKSTVGGMKEGLLSKVGLGKNQALGGFLAERKKVKLEDLQSKVDFRSKIAAHTEGGRALQKQINEASVKDKDGNIKDPKAVRKLEEQLTRRAGRLQAVHEGRSKQIEKLQDEKSAVTSKGMTYSDKSEAVLQRKKSKQETRFMSKDQKETYELDQEASKHWKKVQEDELKEKKLAALQAKKNGGDGTTGRGSSFLTGTATVAPVEKKISVAPREGAPTEDMMTALERKIAEADKAQYPHLYPKEDTPVTHSDDLLDINEKQLAALNKLVAATTVTEEDKLEAKKPETNTIVKEQAKTKEEKKGGIFDSLTDMLKGMIPGFDILTKLPSMFSVITPVLSALAPAAGVAAAGTAGYMFGKHVVNPALDSTAEAITGTKGETVGTALYKGVDKIAGVFGKSDEDKAQEAQETQLLKMGIERLEQDKPLVPMLKAVLEKNKDKLSPVQREKLSSAKMAGRVEKKEDTPREVQTAELSRATATATEIAKTEATKTVAPVASNTSNNTTINNTTNTTRINPPARNFDPTYNERLRSSFA